MYPNLLYPNGMYQMPVYYCPIYGQINQPVKPYRKKSSDSTEKPNLSGFRCMRADEGDSISSQGMQMPQMPPSGQGNFSFFQPGQVPGMPGQMPGPTMQGTTSTPMQQMMNPQQMLQMIERNNPDIINTMAGYNIPITTARQIILSILQAVQSNMQMPGM